VKKAAVAVSADVEKFIAPTAGRKTQWSQNFWKKLYRRRSREIDGLK
jgi:hypothetical protein